ncbi:hypothetical protein FB45DRAFT_919026 [Roridomyces roridus]|uniref:Uncharacterized protein n=1 Tax=Roridomyces roridus TaxID=1738132 RepID=A0AAD7BRJ4_9AGAR|nr:hypothetical protein FB45DRAFT_919026 [Roridomyces roridus]
MVLLGSIVAFLIALFTILPKRATKYLANAKLTSVLARVPVSTQAFTWFSVLASIAAECSAISTPIPGSFLRIRLLAWSIDLAVVVVCDRCTSPSSSSLSRIHDGEHGQLYIDDAVGSDFKIYLESPVGALERLDLDEQDETREISYPGLFDFVAREWLPVYETINEGLQVANSVGISAHFLVGLVLGCIVTSAFFTPAGRLLCMALLASSAVFGVVKYRALINEEIKRRLHSLWNASAAPAICFIHDWIGYSEGTAYDNDDQAFHFLEAVDCMIECFADTVGPLLHPIFARVSKNAAVWICALASFVAACSLVPRPINSGLVLTGLLGLSAILAISVVRARVVPRNPIVDEALVDDEPVVELDVEGVEPELDLIEALALGGTPDSKSKEASPESESEVVALALEPSPFSNDGVGLSTWVQGQSQQASLESESEVLDNEGVGLSTLVQEQSSPRVPQSPGSKAGMWIRDIFNGGSSAEQLLPSARASQTSLVEGADVPQAENGSRRFSMRDSMRGLCNAILTSADLPPMRAPSSPQTVPSRRANGNDMVVVVEKEKEKSKSMSLSRFSPFTLRSRKSASNRELVDAGEGEEGEGSTTVAKLQPALVPRSVHFREHSMDADGEDGDAEKHACESESDSSTSAPASPFRDVLNTPPRKVTVAPIIGLRGLRSPVYASPSQSESEKLPTKVEMKEVRTRRVMLAKRRGEVALDGGKGKAIASVPPERVQTKGGRRGERAWLLQMTEVREEDVSDVSEW